DARSDLFSLAVLAYMLLAGQKPFVGRTGQDTGLQVLSHDPDPPHRLRPEVPQAVSEAVMRALAKNPAHRTPSVARFLEELREAQLQAAAPPPEPVPAPPPAGARGVLLAAVALGAVVLLVGGTLLALRFRRPAEASQVRPTASAPASAAPVSAAPATQAPAPPPPSAAAVPASSQRPARPEPTDQPARRRRKGRKGGGRRPGGRAAHRGVLI